MSASIFDNQVYNREVSFCRVYSQDSKEKLEKMFLKNGISYYIEWQDKPLLQRLFGGKEGKGKNVFTIRINEADVASAKELIEGMENVRLRKQEENK